MSERPNTSGEIDVFQLLRHINPNDINIIKRDQKAYPENIDIIRRKLADANLPLAITSLVLAQQAQNQGLSTDEAYLLGFRDILLLLDRQALIIKTAANLQIKPGLNTPTAASLNDKNISTSNKSKKLI